MNPITNSSSDFDVIVVGARVAGAATAMLLARRGLRVLALDRGAPGSDALSTLALMRTGVYQLERFGLSERLAALEAPRITRTAFHYGRERVDVDIRPKFGVDALYAPRRASLDDMLVDEALRAGAEVRHHVSVVGLVRDGCRVTGVVARDGDGRSRTLRARMVVGADGIHSRVAELAGARTLHHGRAATATVYGFVRGLDRDTSHWYYGLGTAAGCVPTQDGRACVFAVLPASRFARDIRFGKEGLYSRVLSEAAPDLAREVVAAGGAEGLRGFAGVPGHLRRAFGSGWALVGDAGYFRDPITAHGLSDALRDADLLAQAIGRGGDDALRDYHATRNALSLPLLEVTERIARFDWDFDALKILHIELSRAMNAENEYMAGLPESRPAPSSRRVA